MLGGKRSRSRFHASLHRRDSHPARTTASITAQRQHDKENRKVTVGTLKKAIEAVCSTWFIRNVCQVAGKIGCNCGEALLEN
jgi:hypothetical protein